MARTQQPTPYRYVAAAYSLGLAAIFSASILNLCLHRLPAKHLYLLPDVLTERYDRAGNLGVTQLLVGIGITLVMIGAVGSWLSGRTTRQGGHGLADCSFSPNPTASYTDPAFVPSREGPTGSSTMVLQTMKYLGTKPSALPGATVLVER